MNRILPYRKVGISMRFVLLLSLLMMATKTFAQITNPAMPPVADLVSVCPDTGMQLPKIFLCGDGASRQITVSSSNLASVIWEKLDESNCPAVVDDCPITTASCYNPVSTANSFIATVAGHYKVTINSTSGSPGIFYFNVYQNGLNIPITKTDIYCGNPGKIIAAQLTGYEYSLDGTTYQNSNTFSIVTAGDYTVKVRRIGATSDCVFEIPVTIENKALTVTPVVTQSLTSGQQGDIKLIASGVREQYFYKITGASLINEVGPILESEYSFPNLNAGTYTWSVKTDDCHWQSGQVTINSVSPLLITPTVQPVTCQPGSIQVVVTGGTAPYQYFFNGNTTPTSNLIPVTLAGDYTVKVIDNNGLTDQITVSVPVQSAPVYTIEKTNLNCYYPNTWQIKFNVSNEYGNSLKYSIDNGVTFSNNPIFQGLSATPAGTTFKTIIEYTYGGVKCTKTEDVTLVQPQFGLSATAGVSELIGCLPSPHEDKAKIRITNPQGGTPPYQYSFDNQATWGSNTSVLKPAGDYIFHIKDATGCISKMPKVVVENIGVPSITVTTDSFNCDGTANTIINSTTGTSTTFSYTYSLDGGAFQTSPNFSNISLGNHTIGINYQPLIVPTFSNLLKEDFGYGADTTSPGMSAAYCFERQVSPVTCNVSKGWGLNINDGEYAVTSYIVYPFGAWYRPKDHTNQLIAKGRYLVVNIQGDNTRPIIYEKEIKDIIPNQLINVEFFATNLLRIGNTQYNPNLRVALVNASGVEIDFYNTGLIPKTEKWQKYSTQLNPGNNTILKFQIRSIEQNGSGNDLAIDDITAYQIPKLCAATKIIPFTVPTGKAFEASITNTKNATCSGASNGEITIAAQNFNINTGYQYSKDGGATWQTATTSPFKITSLVAGDYSIKVRYNTTATGVCVKSFLPITITVPTPLVTTATVLPLATCSRGATITANSNGGTPFYQYELWDELNTTKIRLAQNSGVFEDVPVGTYTVRGLDANGCGNTTPVSITVVPPPIPIPSLDSTLDLCYDAVNQAKIKINVSSGTAPFSYSLDGGALQNSNTFLNVGPGIHTVEVTDANNCKANTQDIKIGDELKVAAVLTKGLDCTASPDAIIKVTISGGARAIRYRIFKNGIKITPNDIAVLDTVTSFIYVVNEAQHGDYAFEIIDANGCLKTTNLVTINPKMVPVINSITQTQSILCHGGSTAAIQVNLDTSKGVGPFSYEVKDITSLPHIGYGNKLSGLPAGTYEVTVTDANLCPAKLNTIISEPDKIVLNWTRKNIQCSISTGPSTGAIIINSVSGGVANYNYYVTGLGYDHSKLNNPGTTSQNFDVTDFGLYTLDVVDANGCKVTENDILIASPPTDLSINVSTTTLNCSTGGSAIVAVAATTTFSSAGPFYFAIYTPGLVYNSSNSAWLLGDSAKSATFTGLIPGVKYTFIVYDQRTNCYHYKTADSAIATNSSLEVNNLAVKNISCKGSGDGKVTFTVKNNYAVATPISYQVYNSQSLDPVTGVSGTTTIPATSSTTIIDLGPLPFGNYIVLIKESAGATNEGCSIASNPFSIKESIIDLSLLPKVIKNPNCNQYGVISVQAKDGTGPYQYQISAVSATTSAPVNTGLIPPPPPSPSGAWVLDNTFTVNQAGTYTVLVKDAYGCIKPQTIIVTKDPEPVIALSVPNLCLPEGTFTINITATTAGIQPYYLSVNGSVYSSVTFPHTLSNQNSGSYIIAIKDVNGCTNSQNKTIYSPLGLSSTVIKQPTCATNDGEIKAIAVGGSGNFEYKIDSGIYSSVFNFTGLSSGSHTIYIKDTRTLCEKSILVTLEFPAAVTGLTLSQKPVTCNGGNDGSITATIATPATGINDNPVYTYSLNGGTPQASNIFSGLATGSYTVKVISGRGCVETAPVFVNEPSVIVVPTPSVTEFGCNSTNNLNNASISVSGVTGGSGTYTQYEFIKNGITLQFGSNSTYIETNLIGGTYDIKVYDDKGCSGSTVATIQPFYILDKIIVNAPNPISCAASETIQVSVTPNTIPLSDLEYSLSPLPLSGAPIITNSSGIFPGLTVGEYLITAKNTVTNCTIQEVYTVNEPNTFDLTIDSVVDATCFGGTNGSATITLIDRNTPSKAGIFSYTIKDSSGNSVGTTATTTSAGPISISGLKANVYSITATLTTTPFCSVTKKFTISQPISALVLSESHSDITCDVGNNDGRITALPQGGWSDFYEFKWEKAGTAIEDWGDVYELTNLTQGTYKVYVKDAKGCQVEKLVTLSNPTSIALTAASDKSLLQCFADRTATISATSVSGGQGSNYWFSLKTIGASPSVLGPQASNEFKNLGAGTYTVTLTDNWSCTATSSPISINEPNNVVATLSLLTPPTCMNPAQLDLQITGGSSPYSFSADNSIFNLFSATSVPLNGNAGVNHYYVKDSNGCGSYVSNDVVVESPKGLSVTIDRTFAKVNCYGESTASIVATAQGGLGNYFYTLLNELDTPLRPAQSTGTFSNLPAGKYKVKVTSADCVPADSGIITIQQPAAKLIPAYSLTNALCAGSNDGTITVVSTGGTVVIKQAISPNLSQFTESDVFENLAAGTYDLLVQDALGCYEKTTQVIAQPDPIIASTIASSIAQEICFDDKNASFSIDVSGGTLPYNVSLDNPTGPFSTGSTTQTQFDFRGLRGGSHTVYIQDAHNCTLNWTVNLDESVKLNPSTIVNYDCVSNAQHNLVTVNLDASITNFSLVEFALDGGIYQPTNVFTNLPPGDHFIRVKHKNGCIKDTPVFNILKVDPLILSLKEGGLNEIIAVAAGGGGNYKYTFEGEFNDANPSYIYYKTQDYMVTVQDANGCKTAVTQRFNYIDICIPNYFTPNGDGINDTWAPGCTINYKNLTFSVLDRYGRELGNYHLGESWDGKYQGVELPSGDYWFVLQLNNSKDDREFVGHFTLYR